MPDPVFGLFTIDRYGNRRFDAANSTTLGSCTQAICNPTISTANNRFSGGQGYAFDAAGNLTQDAEGKRFSYDAANRQIEFYAVGNGTSTPDAVYFYDGEANRVKKVTATETTVYVYGGSGQVIAEYSTQLAATPRTSYVTTDHLGSPRIVTDQLGAVVSRGDYDAFGEEVQTAQRTTAHGYAAADGLRNKFGGYEKDAESGLDFAQARYYKASHGRFMSVDPLNESGSTGNPQSFNRYTYVMNDPLNLVDPSGMMSCSAEYTYEQCGGDAGFWGGGEFGDQVAYDKQTLGDVDAQTQGFVSLHLERISNSQAGNGFRTNSEVEEEAAVAMFEIFYRAYDESNPQSANPHFKEGAVNVYQFLPVAWKRLNIYRDMAAAVADNLNFGYASKLMNAYSQWMYGTNVVNTESDEFQSTDTIVAIGMMALPGPGGKAKGGKFLYNAWYKATSPSKSSSLIYHLKKHGGGRSSIQYTKDALDFFKKNKSSGKAVTLKDGSAGVLIKGGKGKPGGYFTPNGQIVTFWYK